MEKKISATIEQHFDLADRALIEPTCTITGHSAIGHLCRYCWSR